MVLMADLVEGVPLPANPYTELCHRLLAAHQLMEMQWVDQLTFTSVARRITLSSPAYSSTSFPANSASCSPKQI